MVWRIEGNLISFVNSAYSAREDGEVIVLPGTAPDGIYGITYQYYSGTSDNLKFTVTMSTTEGSIDEQKGDTSTRVAVYTLDNLNNTNTVLIEQI